MSASLKLALCAMAAPFALGSAAFAQTPATETPSAPGYAIPKTSWGVPDLQGTWSNTSITKMQRPPQYKGLILSAEQAKQIAATDYYVVRTEAEKKPVDLANYDKVKPMNGKDLLQGRGGYDAAYIDVGSSIGNVKGEFRSSWVVSPEDGKIPYKPSKNAGFRGNSKTDGPEGRSVGERCLIGFGGSGGPVLNNVLYNNRYQFVQTPTSVMLETEMVHDVRIIPIVKSAAEAHHGPGVIPKWLGDSVGWYEGSTFVVETRNVNPVQGGYISKDGVLVERFTRWNDNQITYEFTVTDPTLYTQPWKGEMALNFSKEPIYEYACHEANYAMPGILAAGRRQEREGIVWAGESKQGEEEGGTNNN